MKLIFFITGVTCIRIDVMTYCSYACERGYGLLRLWRRCLWSGSWRQKMVRAVSICRDVGRKHEDE